MGLCFCYLFVILFLIWDLRLILLFIYYFSDLEFNLYYYLFATLRKVHAQRSVIHMSGTSFGMIVEIKCNLSVVLKQRL